MKTVSIKTGNIDIRRFKVADAILFLSMLLFAWDGYMFSLLDGKHSLGSFQIMALVSGVLVLLIGYRTHEYNSLFVLFIIACVASIIVKHESEYYLLDLSLVIGALFLSRSKQDVLRIYALACSVGFLPFVYIYIQWYLTGRLGIFNRGALHLTTLVLVLVTCLYLSNNKSRLCYILLLIGFIFDFICFSRTSAIAIVIAFIIMFAFDVKGERVNTRFVKWAVLLLLSVVVFLIYNDTIMGFIFKVSSAVDFTAGRTFIWKRLMDHITYFGLDRPMFRLYLGSEYNNAHNSYVQVAAVYGGVSAVIYALWTLQTIIACAKNWKDKEMQALIISIIPFFFISFFESNFVFDSIYPVLGFTVLLTYNRAINRSRELKKGGIQDDYSV